MSSVYPTSSIKHRRRRRTKAELQAILNATKAILTEENGAITIRHLFYRLVALRFLDKTESEYSKLSGYLMNWRRSREIPWSAFADNIRWRYGSRTYADMADAVRRTRDTYRRDLWTSQDVFVEIWTEKDAMASILLGEAEQFGVQVFPLHGFSSGTALYNAAELFREAQKDGKEVYVYYFGDYDPSGLAIDQSAIRSLKEDHGVEINFERVAVTPRDIRLYNLPTRPPKKTDSRSKNFTGQAVELDAMSTQAVRNAVYHCITQHIDPEQWHKEEQIERSERELFDLLVSELEAAG